jgi:hypothetical protein
VKVFISSVRKGLEQERDSLPGLILALGHSPIRFEDFTAQSVPSREACLRGVNESDVYVGLLGPHYGTVFPDTGRSPTHEEYIAARVAGIPRLMFRKVGGDFDAEQQAFIDEIGRYDVGVFRPDFRTAVDLQALVAAAFREQPSGPLIWKSLGHSLEVDWRSGWAADTQRGSSGAELTVHAVPTITATFSRRELAAFPERIASQLRAIGGVASSVGIDTQTAESYALASIQAERRMTWGQADEGGIRGLRINNRGQVSVWDGLPSDSMGSVLDPVDLRERIARDLRLIGRVAPDRDTPFGIALELSAPQMTVVGNRSQIGHRTSVTSMSMSTRDIQLPPDESVTPAAFDLGAEEVAIALVQQLIQMFSKES